MKKISLLVAYTLIAFGSFSQKLKEKDVPGVVKNSLNKKFHNAVKVSWEKEKGNFEANWGGKSGEDNSVQFTPSGDFVELVESIAVSSLPKEIVAYVSAHYRGSKIREAGKITDSKNGHWFEVEIKGKDLVFDTNGNFSKED